MAEPSNNYRDPKVTTPATKKSNLNWLWIALAVLLALALLGWLLGWFGTEDETVIVPAETTTETVIVPADGAAPVVPAN